MFEELTHGYRHVATGPCVAGGPFTFAGQVYPGSYQVSVAGYSGEPFFPEQPFVVCAALRIP